MNDLPQGWDRAPVGVLAALNPKTDAPDETPSGFAPMQMLGTKYRGRLSYEPRAWGDIKKAYTHFRDGDALLAKVTPCFENGKAGIASGLPSGIGAGSSEFYVLRPNTGIDCRYLLAYLSTTDFRRRATMAMTGAVGLRRVPRDFLISDELPVAPSAEQKRIADKLDTVLTRVDAVNTRLARVAPILKRFRQSVLAAATSGRLTQDWRVQRTPSDYVDDDALGSLPKSWRVASIEDIKGSERHSLAIGPFGSNLTVADYSDEGVPLVFVREIRARKFGDERTKFVSFLKSQELNAHRVSGGDILITKMGDPPGDVAIYPENRPDAVITADCIKLRVDRAVSCHSYIAFALESPAFRRVLATAVAGVAQQKVSLARFRVLPVPLPTLEEQTEIVRRVETLFAFADRLEARLQTAKTATERLTPALLAKAFRGELVPQDPNDEPASELLRRLQQEAPPNQTKRGRKSAA